MKHVEACLCAREDRESSFHRCGGTVRLEQACLRETLHKSVLTSEDVQ